MVPFLGKIATESNPWSVGSEEVRRLAWIRKGHEVSMSLADLRYTSVRAGAACFHRMQSAVETRAQETSSAESRSAITTGRDAKLVLSDLIQSV